MSHQSSSVLADALFDIAEDVGRLRWDTAPSDIERDVKALQQRTRSRVLELLSEPALAADAESVPAPSGPVDPEAPVVAPEPSLTEVVFARALDADPQQIQSAKIRDLADDAGVAIVALPEPAIEAATPE